MRLYSHTLTPPTPPPTHPYPTNPSLHTPSPRPPLPPHTLIPPTPHSTHPHPAHPSPTPLSHQPLTPHTFIPPTPHSTHPHPTNPLPRTKNNLSSCEHTPPFVHATHSFLHLSFFLHHTPYFGSLHTTFSFTRPKSDTCKTCDSMKVRIKAEASDEVQRRLQSELLLHQRKAERTYHQLQEDTALSQSDPDTQTITFDLQQSLPTPVLTVNVVYYKRQLWTFNLGVHCCRTGVGHMHMWSESEGSRGSQEIGSCVLTFLKEHPVPSKHLIAYSDSCGGQNRNISVVCLWQHIVSSDGFSYTTVDHKFMVSCHSYLPNDRDFGSIEGARRRQTSLYVPEQWGELVRKARRVNPFQVRWMTQADFVSVSLLKDAIVNRKANTDGEKVEWLKMHWIHVEKSSPLCYKYRYTLNDREPWKIVDLRPKQVGCPSDMGRVELPPLYDRPRSISDAKYCDLQQLLCYIPPVYHEFYTKLTSQTNSSHKTLMQMKIRGVSERPSPTLTHVTGMTTMPTHATPYCTRLIWLHSNENIFTCMYDTHVQRNALN